MTQYSQKLAYILLLGFILVNPRAVNAASSFSDPLAAPAQLADNGSKTLNSLPAAAPAEERYTTVRLITAYTSTVDQCDDTPFTTANGTTVHDGIVAANWLKFGTRVRIPEMFGDKVFIVADRMHPRFDDRMDIWMSDISEARKFGVRKLAVEVL